MLFLSWHILTHTDTTAICIGQEFEKMKEKSPENFRLDFAVSREQTNDKGEKMYIQTRMAQYAEELWQLLKKDNTFVYMCGLKGMEKGIDDIMVSLAARDGKTHFFLSPHLKRNLFSFWCTIWRETLFIIYCVSLCTVGIDWIEYKRQLKKAEQWNVEVY